MTTILLCGRTSYHLAMGTATISAAAMQYGGQSHLYDDDTVEPLNAPWRYRSLCV